MINNYGNRSSSNQDRGIESVKEHLEGEIAKAQKLDQLQADLKKQIEWEIEI